MKGGRPTRDSTLPYGHRPLTTDEEYLWSLIARTVRPLRQSKKPATAGRHKAIIRAMAHPEKKRVAVDQDVAVRRQRVALAPALAPIIRREKQQLARGRVAIDARIDLHGMTQAEAHVALRSFLHRSQANDAKFVLIITGKGAPNAPRAERGILRQQVPLWLALPEFRRYVLGFDLAHTGHGGEGALYVRLRKAAG